jgi:hypothetical protein
MTVESKVAAILGDAQWGTPKDRALILSLFRAARIEQDRDTRCACMSAVSMVISAEMHKGGSFPLGSVSAMESAIMNVKAV